MDKKSKSYVSSILTAFQTMDITYLHKYLKDIYSYQDAPKEVFLTEMEGVFDLCKNEGDQNLLIFKGACGDKVCENCDKKGYRFIGNNSRNYLDLIFEIVEDDIRDIFMCSKFNTEEDSGELGYCIGLDINVDDQVTFNKTPEYLTKLSKALAAVDELVGNPRKAVSFEYCNYWIQKYSFLNESIGSHNIFKPQMKWSEFSDLYAELKDWCSFMEHRLNTLRVANIAYNNNFSELELIAWVVKYESLFQEIPNGLRFDLIKEGEYFKTGLNTNLVVEGEEFCTVYNFNSNFFENHNDLMIKYRTYTLEHESEMIKRYGDDSEELLSLKYHLKTREELKLIGIEIKLNLDQHI